MRFTSHVTISGCFLINRITKFQTFFDCFRAKIEQLIDNAGNLTIRHVNVGTAISIYKNIDRTSHTDSIAHLYKHFICYTCRNHILCDMACCISCTTVYLARIFSGESTTTVSTFTTISINDNLTTCQTGISVRTTNYELARRIHMINDFIIKQCQHFIVMDRSNDTRHQNFNHITADDRQHFFVSFQLGGLRIIFRLDKVIMLRRNNDCIDANRSSVVIIFDSNLAFGIGAEVSHHLSFTTNVGQHLQNAVCQIKRKRHIVFRFIGSVAKHHTLVACTLFHRVLTLYTTVDIRTLLMNSGKYATRVTFEHVLSFGITDFLNHLACDEL